MRPWRIAAGESGRGFDSRRLHMKLWEAQGPRTVTLGNVTFPVSPKAEP
jgi:hypothetical protein